VKLDQIVYFTLSSGNGGILLDFSEKGLAFQAAGRLMRLDLSIPLLGSIDRESGDCRRLDVDRCLA
jgi:hypothetical protein